MRAVVMAGGEGTRLRPLTCDIPKPMARLCGKPVLEYILDLLEQNGVTQATLTLQYLKNRIIEHFDGNKYNGINLTFCEEDKPLGTAGSVKNAAKDFEDSFIVISGDAICDFDLKAAFEFHKANQSDATLIVTKVNDPREYGLVLSDNGRIKGFIEKPSYSQVCSDLANTGIYILNPECLKDIPDDVSFDFSKDLFPLMLKQGKTLMAYDASGYWCDIGDLESYAKCQKDILLKKVKTNIKLPQNNKYYHCEINEPVFIGENVTIGNKAVIEAGSVIEDNCYIGERALIKGCIILENSYIGDRANLCLSIVCSGATVKTGASMYEGSVLGPKSTLGAFAEIMPFIKVWPQKIIEDKACISDNIKFGFSSTGVFDDDGINGVINEDITPELCAKIGSAVGSIKNIKAAAIGCGFDKASKALTGAVVSGLLSTSTEAFCFNEIYESAFAFCLDMWKIPIGIYISSGDKNTIKIISSGGLTLDRATERNIEGYITRGEFLRCKGDSFGESHFVEGFSELYINDIVSSSNNDLSDFQVTVHSTNKSIRKDMNEVLRRLNVKKGKDLIINIDYNGKTADFILNNGDIISYFRLLTFCAEYEFSLGNDVSIPFDSPRIIDNIAEKYKRSSYRYFYCPADNGDKKARELAKSQMWVRDGLKFVVKVLNILKENNISLQELNRMIPSFAVAEKIVACKGSMGETMRGFTSNSKSANGLITEGVLINKENGKLLIKPLKTGKAIRVIAEASNMEAASELCNVFENLINLNNLDT